MSPDGITPESLSQRLQKLEEACAFDQRTVEHLGEEVLALNRRMADTLRQLQGLERRMESLGKGGADAGESEAPGVDPESLREE